MLLFLLLRASSPAAAQRAPVVKVAGSSGKTTCSLNIQGNSAGDGIKSASLICTGSGTVTVAVHQQLQDVLVHKGVKTVSGEKSCELQGDPCLLLLCGSDAEFIRPVINGVQSVDGIWGVLCFDMGSKITLRKGQFTSCGMPIVGIFDYQASALVDQCTFQGNSGDRHGAGPVFDGATLLVKSSTFKGNVAVVANDNNGGAMYLIHGSTTIVDSIFHSNEATNGGALFLAGSATVSIQGSQFVRNTAGSFGAAIYAWDEAKVDILPVPKQAPGMWVWSW
mgnify:FL=1